MGQFILNNQWITIAEFEQILSNDDEVVLGEKAIEAIQKGYAFLHKKIKVYPKSCTCSPCQMK